MITSAQNPRIKLARELINERKAREESNNLAVEGVRLAEEALLNGWPVQYALWSEQLGERGRGVLHQLAQQQVPADEIPPALMARISDTETPQGLILVVTRKLLPLPKNVNFLIALDGVRDPGNLGTILRSACAFGSQGVVLLPGSTDAFSSKVLRAGMGAQFRLPIMELSVEEFHKLCKKDIKPALNIFLADMQEASPCWSVNLKKALALVIGGEAAGATRELYTIADGRLFIPMPAGSESLNAAVAASILAYEIMRQRQS
jgi:RNA methyltransferase, TrmH family